VKSFKIATEVTENTEEQERESGSPHNDADERRSDEFEWQFFLIRANQDNRADSNSQHFFPLSSR